MAFEFPVTEIVTGRGIVAVAQAGPREGTPWLLVHGGSVAHQWWLPLAEHLVARGYRVLAPDLLGHGRTPDPGPRVAPDLFGGDALLLADVIDTFRLHRPHVLGWSMGGPRIMHGLGFGGAGPRGVLETRVGKVAFLGALTHDMNRYTGARMQWAIAAMMAGAPGAFLDRCAAPDVLALTDRRRLVAEARRCAARTRLRVVAAMRRSATRAPGDLGARVASSRRPILVLHGRDDQVVTTAAAEDLARLTETEPVWLPGGHAVHWFTPGLVAEQLDEFSHGSHV